RKAIRPIELLLVQLIRSTSCRRRHGEDDRPELEVPMRPILLESMAALLSAVVILAALVRLSLAATPDVISEWSVAASNAAAASGMAPFRTPITFALLHLGMYDAVTAIRGDREPYAVNPAVAHPASAQAAAIEAGYRMLVAEFPTQVGAL